jgi:hydroxypyruvate isomerase
MTMDRRTFVASLAVAGTTLAAGGECGAAPDRRQAGAAAPPTARRAFRLRYAPHFGMFKAHAGEDLVAQLEFMAAEGFTALEDNELRQRSAADQARIARALERLRMTMGVFVSHTIGWDAPNLTTGDAAKRDAFLAEVRDSVEVAKRMNARWMVCVPGRVDPRLEMSYQTANVVESLKRAAGILEPHGLVLLIEPLNLLRDHPGQFLSRVPQGYQICRAVGSPSLKLQLDLYHAQIQEGNLIPNIDAAWSEVAYVQVGDNPGRHEPGTGEINYRNVFRHLHGKGFRGVVGMEHGNSRPGREGERAVIDAYVAADGWA